LKFSISFNKTFVREIKTFPTKNKNVKNPRKIIVAVNDQVYLHTLSEFSKYWFLDFNYSVNIRNY